MENYKKYFKDKKITIMGLGLLGRGLGYTKFLAECGAELIVTDLKTKEQLSTSLKKLEKYKNIKFTFGKHNLIDFKNRDMIIKAAGVPLDSPYAKEAKKNKIPIEMDVSLFTKLASEIILIGVTGTRGKSMTTQAIYEILRKNEKFFNKKVYIGGNVRGVSTLPLLKKVKSGDILVAELDSWQLQGFGESKISPHVSVFTSFMPDHMNYYKNSMKKYFADKANIFKYQRKGDILIVRPDMKKLIPKTIKSKLIVVNPKIISKYKLNIIGEHQKENIACAIEVANYFKIPEAKIATALKEFKGMEGRLEYVKTIRGVKIYNDNNATTPAATIAGIESLGDKKIKKIILICGGNDKKLPIDKLVKYFDKYCKLIVTIPGTGTDALFETKFKCPIMGTKNLKEAIKVAFEESKKEDVILFSPAFSSFSQFNNEYERNDLFMKIIKKLK